MGEKKNIIIIAATCFVLIIAGVVAYMFLFSSSARINKFLKTADQYLSEENYSEAVTYYVKALRIRADNEKAREGIINTYCAWADSLVSKGNISGALRILENAVENNEFVKDSQKLNDKIKELKDSITASTPKEVVEEEPEETFDFDISINESDFELILFGKNITEWDLSSITEFVENDSSLHLAKTEANEKVYLNDENTLEVILPDDGEAVVVNDKDYVLIIQKVDYKGYTNSCSLYQYPGHKPSLGNVLPIPAPMGETIEEYLADYSPELNNYILDKSINYHLVTELRNAVLSTSEWVKDGKSAEIRGLKINFGTWYVDLHHSGHIVIDSIRYYY